MVSPLCDNWALDQPYAWPYDGPEPFPAGHSQHALCEQMAMAKVCGWDPTFVVGFSCVPRNQAAATETTVTPIAGGCRVESRIDTPYGPLRRVVEQLTTQRVLKAELETREDYHRKAWFYRQQLDSDEDRVLDEGRMFHAAVGERGVLGTWVVPPIASVDRDNLFYHLADWPDECEELRQAAMALTLNRLELLARAGLDYIFYCVDGTEWLSPAFFRERVLADTLRIFEHWRSLGGWVLWHSCGRVGRLIPEGFYNECRPEVFETLSEPPVGDVPSLRWARERLDQRIATKGNISLEVLLNGTPEQVRQAVASVRDQTRGYRHIAGLTDDVLANTPLANCRAYVEEGRRGG